MPLGYINGSGLNMNENLLYKISETVGPLLVKTLCNTVKIEVFGWNNWAAAARKGPLLYSCLHGRMVTPIWYHRNTNIVTIVSQSRDGELVSRLVNKIGHETVRGSSHRGGAEAFRGLLRVMKNGKNAAIMVDGPKGPRGEPKVGIIAIARSMKVPILPIAASYSDYWEFNSWDRFQLPKPFAKSVFIYGDPLEIPRNVKPEQFEDYRAILEKRMLELEQEADRLAGKQK